MSDGPRETEAGEWRVRPMRASDEPSLHRLAVTVFGHTMTTDRWRSQFSENPFSRPIVHVAETASGSLIGQFALVPLPFLKAGRPVLAALSVQSMIHPSFQRRGILKSLGAEVEKQLDADGVAIAHTFLNDNSLTAYTKHFGWTHVNGPSFVYFTVLDAAAALRSRLRHELGAKAVAALVELPVRIAFRARRFDERCRVREVPHFDERADRLWTSFSRDLVYSVDRTARYLNWRVSSSRGEYSRFVAEDGADLIGLVVTRADKKFGLELGYIVELLYDPAFPDVGRQLLARALEHLRGQGCSMATALSVGSEHLSKTLRRAGFWRLPRSAMPHGIHFCIKDRQTPAPPATTGWFLSWSDHDVV